MSLSRVEEMLSLYGREVIFLIGGGLFTHGPNLIENCRYFSELVSEIPK
jgi:ribulose-bisphosphate carboxylase large chain